MQKTELKALRSSIGEELRRDTFDHLLSREQLRNTQLQYFEDRQRRKEALFREYKVADRILEEELTNQGFPPIPADEDVLTEEELAMSYLLSQVEMETILYDDYSSIVDATKTMATELQQKISEFDALEKDVSTIESICMLC
jgi:hypothetical protein